MFILSSKKKPKNHLCEKQDFSKIYAQCLITAFGGRSYLSSWHLFTEIARMYHKEDHTKYFMAASCDFNDHPYHFAIFVHFPSKLLNVATATSLTSRTGTSPPPTHCTASELWFNSPVTLDTLLNKAPLLSSASAQEIHTGMTQSLYAKVPLCFFSCVGSCSGS